MSKYTAQCFFKADLHYSLREVFSFTIGFSVFIWTDYMFKLHHDDDVRQMKTFSEWQRLVGFY